MPSQLHVGFIEFMSSPTRQSGIRRFRGIWHQTAAEVACAYHQDQVDARSRKGSHREISDAWGRASGSLVACWPEAIKT
jgi:hypothetical protein